jgi:hypothetical protein
MKRARVHKPNGATAQPRGRKRLDKPRAPKPIWDEILAIACQIPAPDFEKLPTDLSAKHDHYLYGSRHFEQEGFVALMLARPRR